MIGAQGLFPDRQRAPVERLCLRIPALGQVHACEVVQARGDMRVIGAEGFLDDRQRTLVERLCLRVLALILSLIHI